MKKVLFGLITTAAVVVLTYAIVKGMFMAYPTWFADLTRYLFLGQIDYYARIGVDLKEFRIVSAISYLLMTTCVSVVIVAEVTDLIDAIGKVIFGVKAA